ncbi:MAG: histidinol dehydrogenase [Chloroflexota bacterium]
MKRITGIAAARRALASRDTLVPEDLPPRVKEKVKAVFGKPLTAEQAVRRIVDDVRERGDAALRHYARVIDGVEIKDFRVSKAEVRAATREIGLELLSALRFAAARVRDYHVSCRENSEAAFFDSGVGRRVLPLDRVGIYVPGGTAAYPSTVLMTAVPARVAGVGEIIMCSPPKPDGNLPEVTLAAAEIAGVDTVYKIGGAQAIAAMAYGTKSVPRVDKICGPGNIFVMLAKKLVFGQVAIDGLQGPSEVVVVADSSANPAFCAADLLAQAEHDAMARVVMITTSKSVAERTGAEVKKQLAGLGRSVIASEALDKALMIVVRDLAEAAEAVNLFAPEHLSVQVKDAGAFLLMVRHVGCIFVGGGSPVALGDYIAGPSHVLPTSGSARFSSPLGVSDFLKVNSMVSVDAAVRKDLTRAAITIAQAEGLTAHARALELRLEAGRKK